MNELMDRIGPLLGMALATGLLGGGHCIGMCGGLVAALSLARNGERHFLFHLCYNLGRITTYAGIGLAGGWLAQAAFLPAAAGTLTRYLLVASDLFIIVVGLGSAGLLARISFFSLELPWISGLVTRSARRLTLLPVFAAAFPLGLVMGFLPCGFLYAMAITAAQTGSAAGGALVMLFFGLGTLPSLVLFGALAGKIRSRLRQNLIKTAGIFVAAGGAYNLYWHIEFFFMQ